MEVATNLDTVVAVRDSKQPDEAVLAFPPAEFRSFITLAKAGRLDRS